MDKFEKQYRKSEEWVDKIYTLFGGIDPIYEYNYLDLCIDICKFLNNSTDYNGNLDSHEDYYMLTDSRCNSFIWLYNILPSYIISKIKNQKKNSFCDYLY